LAVPTSTADENNLADSVWMSRTGKRLKMFKAYDFCDPLHGNGREGASVTEVNHVSETVTLEGNRPQSTDTLFSITSPARPGWRNWQTGLKSFFLGCTETHESARCCDALLFTPG